MHPLINNLEELKISEIEIKINDLSKKYFMTHNVDVQSQISSVLDTLKDELAKRQREELDRAMESRNKHLDKLINVS